MNPLLEIRAAACLFVVGPQLSRNAVQHAGKLNYDSVVRSGIKYLQEFTDRGKIGSLEKEGQLKAMQTVMSLLRKKGLYEDWVKTTFTSDMEHGHCSIPDSVHWLLELHRLGAMLACTQYDTLLDTMAGLRPVVMSEEQSFAEWLQGGKKVEVQQEAGVGGEQGESLGTTTAEGVAGFLHLHGVQTMLDSIRMLPYSETREHGSTDTNSIPGETLTALRRVFHNKLVFLVGFDDEYQDPLLPSFLELVYPDGDAKVLKNPPILLTSRSAKCSLLQCEPAKVLQLRIHAVDRLRDAVLPGEAKNFSAGMFKIVTVNTY